MHAASTRCSRRFAKGEFDRRRDRPRHSALAGVRRAHPVTERSVLRYAAADAAERDAAEQLFGRLVEDQEGVRLVAGHVLFLALEPAPEGRHGSDRRRARSAPTARERRGSPPCSCDQARKIRRRRRAQIEPVATQQGLGIDRSGQAEKRHRDSPQRLGDLGPAGNLGDSADRSDGGRRFKHGRAGFANGSAEMASTRAIISSSESGRP